MGTAPTQFLAHVYYGQTAGWMKMLLGTEVDLSLWQKLFSNITSKFTYINAVRDVAIAAVSMRARGLTR